MSDPCFKIGDLVVHKAHKRAVAIGENLKFRDREIVGIILTMNEETCCGGMQRSYAVRWATSDVIDSESRRMFEFELEAAPDKE